MADAQAELEAQSASAGKESAQQQSGGALSEVIKRRSADAPSQRLKDENAELERKVEALDSEEQARSSLVSRHSFRNVISTNRSLSFRIITLPFFTGYTCERCYEQEIGNRKRWRPRRPFVCPNKRFGNGVHQS